LTADNTTWTHVSISLDLDAKTTTFSYTDSSSNNFTATDVAWSSGITDTTVQTLNMQMEDLVSKNYFDDFSFSPVSAIPEPGSATLCMLAMLGFICRRKH
jgi:hypothetical protein